MFIDGDEMIKCDGWCFFYCRKGGHNGFFSCKWEERKRGVINYVKEVCARFLLGLNDK